MPADAVIPTGAPFWLRVHGTWVRLEGATPGVQVATDRPRSEFRSVEGNRYTQRALNGRRQWDLSIRYAAAEALTISALRAAIAADGVMLASTDQLTSNMLPERSCYGAAATAATPAINCAGLWLPSLAAGQVVPARVRGGVATTLSCWTTAAAGATALSVTLPGGALVAAANAVAGGRASVTFTLAVDSDIEIVASTAAQRSSGLMLAELPAPIALPTAFVHGEGSGMPCPVEVQDPGDTLATHHDGYWRHDYTVTIREVG